MKKSIFIFLCMLPCLFCGAQKGTIKVMKNKMDACDFTVAGLADNSILLLDTLWAQKGPRFFSPGECNWKIASFEVAFVVSGAAYSYLNTGEIFNEGVKKAFLKIPAGGKVYFENVRVTTPEGIIKIVPGAIYILSK